MAAWLPALLEGALHTLLIAVCGIPLAALLALCIGQACLSPTRWLRWPARAYVELFRGTSALIQLFWLFYVLPQIMDLRLGGVLASVLAMGLMISAYAAEVVRSTIAAVPRGQAEAAHALGLGPWATRWLIVLPQAIPAMLPPWGNLVIELTKLSCLAGFVGVADLLQVASVLRAQDPDAGLRIFLLTAGLYGLCSFLMVTPVRLLEAPSRQRALGKLLGHLGRGCARVAKALHRVLPLRKAGNARWWKAGFLVLPAALCVYVLWRILALWRWDFAVQVFPRLLEGLYTTVLATLGGSALALSGGLLLAVCVRLPLLVRPLSWLCQGIRATPVLVQLFVLFYGILPATGLVVPPLWVGIIGLGLHYATYCAEVYRAGLASVPAGQWEAAHALGLRPLHIWLTVMMPQAWSRSLPGLGNYVIAMFKETPWLSAITVMELLGRAEAVQSEHYRSLEPFTLVGLLFLLVSLLAAAASRGAERLWPVRHG